MPIIVFGSIGLDLVTRVKSFPRPGETAVALDFFQAPGGKGANQAVVAKSLGATVKMVGAVGQDPFSQPATSVLKAVDVDLSDVKTVAKSTGVATILVNAEGQNSIAVYAGANSQADITAISTEKLKGNIVLMQNECSLDQNEALAVRAKRNNAVVVLNAAPAYDLKPEMLKSLDYLVVNETEAQHIAKQYGLFENDGSIESYARLAMDLYKKFGCVAIITLGEKGAVVCDNVDQIHAVSAPKVEVFDTTGAGDAFVGALVSQLDCGAPLMEAVPFAIAAGSLACELSGAQVLLNYADVRTLSNSVKIRQILI